MTERERETLMAYLIAEDFRIDDELHEMQARMRSRKIGIEDCVEMMLVLSKRECFDAFALTILRLLKLGN